MCFSVRTTIVSPWSTNGVKPNGNKQGYGNKPSKPIMALQAATNHGAAQVHTFKMHKMRIGIVRELRVGRPQILNCKNSWGRQSRPSTINPTFTRSTSSTSSTRSTSSTSSTSSWTSDGTQFFLQCVGRSDIL